MRINVGWRAAVALLALGLASVPSADATDSTPLPTYVTNGAVVAFAFSGDTLYLGGDFDEIGPLTGPGVGIDATSGGDLKLPRVSGGFPFTDVVATISDGAGGWYIGGQFSRVGGLQRSNAAHILADGTVGAWDPDVNGAVGALALSPDRSTVYIGGAFAGASSINGSVARNNVAAVAATTGAATGWDPNVNGTVRALVVSGSTVFIGGTFSGANAINGNVERNHAAAVNDTNGAVTAWDPNVDGDVTTLAVSGSTVYLGGAFLQVNGNVARNSAAAVDATSGAATAWDPHVNGTLNALLVSGSTVYLAGAFSGANSVGSATRNQVAAVDATTGAVNAWDPDADDLVAGLAISGSTVYLAGGFRTVGGTPRNSLAATDAVTGALLSWNPKPDSLARTVAVSGATVYAGGVFSSINGVERRNAAAIDLTTGEATAWDPRVGRENEAGENVASIAVSGSTVYLGGVFHGAGAVNGDTTRNGLAAVDATTGIATAWDPDVDGDVGVLKVSGSTIYAAGEFGHVNGTTPRNNLAAFDTAGTATQWNPDVDGRVRSLALLGPSLYLAGSFTKIGDADRAGVGSVDLATGAATGWAPPSVAPGDVISLAAMGSTVYLAGAFQTIGGAVRHNAAAVDATSGAVNGWDPNFSSFVFNLAATESAVYAAGGFGGPGAVNGTLSRNFVAGIDPVTGAATAWDPDARNLVVGLAAAGPLLAAGGSFHAFGDQGSFAVFGEAPRFTAQPVSQTVAEGASATFAAAVSGGPAPALQWQVSTDGGASFRDLAGSTGATLTVPQVNRAQSGSLYRAQATSLAGTATSDAASLTVAPGAAGPGPAASTPGQVKVLTRRAKVKRGRVRVTLSCTGDTACTGRLKITARRAKRKPLRVATGRYTVAAGTRRTVKLRVSNRVRKQLFKSQSKRRATITLTPATGKPVKAKLTLTGRA